MTEQQTRGLDLFIESVLKPDHDLRQQAKDENCYDELMQVRDKVLNYLRTIRQFNDYRDIN